MKPRPRRPTVPVALERSCLTAWRARPRHSNYSYVSLEATCRFSNRVNPYNPATLCHPKMGGTRFGCKPTGMWFSTMARAPRMVLLGGRPIPGQVSSRPGGWTCRPTVTWCCTTPRINQDGQAAHRITPGRFSTCRTTATLSYTAPARAASTRTTPCGQQALTRLGARASPAASYPLAYQTEKEKTA